MNNNFTDYGQQTNEPFVAPGYQQNNVNMNGMQNNMNPGAVQNNVNMNGVQNNMNPDVMQNNVYAGARQMNNNINNSMSYNAQPVNGYTNTDMNNNVNRNPQQYYGYANPNVYPNANVNPNANMNLNANINQGVGPAIVQNMNPGMIGMQRQNSAAGTRIYGYGYRMMEGIAGYIIISAVIAAIIGGLIGYAITKGFPDILYETKRVGYKIIKTKTISGSFLMGTIEGAVVGFFYALFFGLFIAHSKKEVNGGSFNMDELHLDYSVRSPGFNKFVPSLKINGYNGTIATADERDKSVFLPMLKSYDKKAYRKYKFRYYITRVRGRIIRISADGRTIYIDGTKVIDNKQQIVSVLPQVPGGHI